MFTLSRKAPARFPSADSCGLCKGPLAFHGGEDHTGRVLIRASSSPIPRLARTLKLGHASAATTTSPLDDQGQSDGVLLAAEKPLCPVDRIQGPEPIVVLRCPTVVDPLADSSAAIGSALVRRPPGRTHVPDAPGPGLARFPASRSSAASSSAITASSGNDSMSTRQINAWLPKSATVTGLLSFLARTSDEISAATARQSRAPRAPPGSPRPAHVRKVDSWCHRSHFAQK